MAQTRQPLPPLRRAGGDGSTGVVGPSRCGANGRVSAGLTSLRGVSTVSIARKYGLLGDTSFTRRILTDARTENLPAASRRGMLALSFHGLTACFRQGYVASGGSARTCGRCCDGSSGSSGLRGRNVSIMEENGPLGCGCGILGGFAPACTSPWFSLCETTGRAGRTLLGQCARGRVRKLR